jgi:hypothetical protein
MLRPSESERGDVVPVGSEEWHGMAEGKVGWGCRDVTAASMRGTKPLVWLINA